MAYIPSSGSVVAFQADPTKLVATVSIVSMVPSSVQVGASIMGTVPVTQTTSPWLVNVPTPSYIAYQAAGSVLAVSGSFSATPQSSIIALQLAGSVMAVSSSNSSVQLLSGVGVIGSVAVLQGTSPWQVNVPTPSYISYQAAGSIMAVSATVNTGNSSVQLLANTAVIGSVAVIQSTSPWFVNVPTPSYIAYQLAGSVMAVNATVNTGNSSVQLLANTAVIGSVAVLQGTSPWLINVPTPSYIAYQAAGSIMAVSATVNTGNSSVQLLGGTATIGSVTALQGTNPFIVTGSVQGVMSVLGTVPVTQSTTPWVVNVPTPSYIAYQAAGSIMAVSATVNTGNSSVQLLAGVAAIGSVTALQGTSPWLVNVPTPSYIAYQAAGSIMAVSATVNTGNSSVQLLANTAVIGSVAVLQGTNPWLIGNSSVQTIQGTTPWVIQSIVGTYPDNSAWTEGNSGVYMLGVRNDTMASVSAADVRYTPWTVGPVGETITANSPISKWIQGTTSVFSGVSVQGIAAQGASIFTYITGLQIANASANNVYLTFTGGLGGISSVLGYTIAPANGGSNIVLPNAWKTGANSGFSASVSGVSSIYISMQGFISKT